MCPPLFPGTNTATCNGFPCVDNGTTCTCGAGWTSVGDFHPAPTPDTCLLPVQAVVGLWSTSVALWVIMTFLAGREAWRRLRQGGKVNRAVAAANQSLQAVQSVCFASGSVIRAANPTTTGVGVDAATTTLIVLGVVLVALDGTIIVLRVVGVLAKSVDAVNGAATERAVRRELAATTSVAIVCSFAPFISVARPDLGDVGAYVFFGVWTLFAVVHGVLLPRALRALAAQLDSMQQPAPSQSAAQTTQLRDKLRSFIVQLQVGCAFQVVFTAALTASTSLHAVLGVLFPVVLAAVAFFDAIAIAFADNRQVAKTSQATDPGPSSDKQVLSGTSTVARPNAVAAVSASP